MPACPSHSVRSPSEPRPATRNLLQFPLLGELLIQHLQLLDQLLARLHHGLARRHLAVGLHAQFEGREERVRDLVAGEEDVGGFDEFGAQEVAQRVVFFVEGEKGGVGDAWVGGGVSVVVARVGGSGRG